MNEQVHHNMKPNLFANRRVVLGLLLSCVTLVSVRAGGDIQTSGDMLQFALPALALGATVGHRNEETGSRWDRIGTLEFVETAALTLGVTYALSKSR